MILYTKGTRTLYQSINPYTLETLGEYETFSDQQLTNVLILAEKAFADWKHSTFASRNDKMLRVAQLLRERKDQLALLITSEMGKIISEAYGEIEKCAAHCEYYARHAEEILRDTVIPTEVHRSVVAYEPVGAVLAIMPWNYPFWQVFRYAAPTLMAGNVTLLKHAPNVIGCGQAIEAIFREAGFPEGVFQHVVLEPERVEQLIQADIVQGITLTGSERAGSNVAALAGKHIKKSVMELGGSDPFIVLADADLQKAARVAVQSRLLNAGQACICAKRFIAVADIYNDFLDAFQQEMLTYKQGNPLNPEVKVGPMARLDLADTLKKQLDNSIRQGARPLLGGQVQGCSFAPTLLSEITPQMEVFRQETFGPLAAMLKVKDPAEALAIANQSRYGLGASLWTQDLEEAYFLARKVETGNVFVNSLVRSDSRLPFGGIKKSGYGRELGEYGLKEFTNIKTIVIEA